MDSETINIGIQGDQFLGASTSPAPAVSVSAAGTFLHKVLTRKSIKMHSFCMKIHAFSEVFEEQLEFPEQEKNIRKFVPAQELCCDHNN